MTSERVPPMADAPKLNSATDATTAKYAPLSALAVVSLVVAVVYVALLVYLGIQAYLAGQPLLQWWLFAVPAVGVFLAFIARRQIQNSEGARTGTGYANIAWWTCVVAGACYFAYLLANDLAVRADSEQAVVKWAGKVGQVSPTDPADKAAWEAFEQTLDPGSPLLGNPQAANTPQMALPYGQFRNSPLVLVWARNRADAKFVPNGLRNWDLTLDGKLNCEAAAVLSCPEGEFPVTIPLQGTTAGKGKGRVWQVMQSTQFKFLELEQAPRTKYGWLVTDLERDAVNAADQFFEALTGLPPPLGPSVAVDRFISGHRNADYTARLVHPEGMTFRTFLVGPTALLVGPTDPMEVPPADRPPHFFARVGGQPITDDPFTRPDGQKVERGLTSLRRVWEQPGLSLIAPGFKSRHRQPEMAPKFPVVDFADPARVVVKVPVDFLPRREDFVGKTFSTGYLVLACDDPTAIKELADAREAAKAGRDKPTKDRPATARSFPVRVLRFETDLMPVTAPDMGAGGGGGGGGMPGM